jgi:hypothetical protein
MPTDYHDGLQHNYLDILMPPLIAKWQQLSSLDNDIFALLQCFTSIAHVFSLFFIDLDLLYWFLEGSLEYLELVTNYGVNQCNSLDLFIIMDFKRSQLVWWGGGGGGGVRGGSTCDPPDWGNYEFHIYA